MTYLRSQLFLFLTVSLFALNTWAATDKICDKKSYGEVCVTRSANFIVRTAPGQYENCYASAVGDDGSLAYSCSNGSMAGNIKNIDVVYSVEQVSGIKKGADIFQKDDEKLYRAYYVSNIYSDGVLQLYSRATSTYGFRTLSDILARQVTALNEITIMISTSQGSRQSTFRSGSDIVIRTKSGEYHSNYVSRIYSDGSAELYDRSTSTSQVLTQNELSAQLVEKLNSMGPIKISGDIIIRDADKTYNTYYVSNIYSDGTIDVYGRATSTSSLRPFSDLQTKFVVAKSQMDVNLRLPVGGSRASTVRQGSDIIAKVSDRNYHNFYVTTIYSDQVFNLYDRSTSQSVILNRAELEATLVESAEQTTFTMQTPAGPVETTVRKSTDIILRVANGEYQNHYVSALFSDDMNSLYNRSTNQSVVLSRAEIEPMLVEKLKSVSGIQTSSVIALPESTVGASLRRSDFYVSSIFTDGMAALYNYEDGTTVYNHILTVAASAIQTTETLDNFQVGNIFLVIDRSGAARLILVQRGYADHVIRFIDMQKPSDEQANPSKKQFLATSDLQLVSVECDKKIIGKNRDKYYSNCSTWWADNFEAELKKIGK